MGSLLCEHCMAACCRYIALPLDKPTTVKDYNDIRWYLMHHGICVFVEEGDWYVQFQTRCKNLAADNRCGIYESRPEICCEYEPGECDYAGGTYGYDNLFTHPQQIDEYYLQKTGRKLEPPGERGSRRRARPAKSKSAQRSVSRRAGIALTV